MSKRLNETFQNVYKEIDRICCEKFGITSGGFVEYINRLNNARFAPDRDDVLPKLVRYKNLYTRFLNEPGAVRKSDEITKDDIKWLNRFRKDLEKKRDPISKYLRQAWRYAFLRKLRNILLVVLCFAVLVLVIIIYALLQDNAGSNGGAEVAGLLDGFWDYYEM